jgi:hypothetical protein
MTKTTHSRVFGLALGGIFFGMLLLNAWAG